VSDHYCCKTCHQEYRYCDCATADTSKAKPLTNLFSKPLDNKAQRVVVCAAIKDNFTEEVVIGIRHRDTHMTKSMNNSNSFYGDPYTEGFVDQHGVFMDRKEALAIAIAAGQIGLRKPKGFPKDVLLSEDLY
jgi:hypothetical protein